MKRKVLAAFLAATMVFGSSVTAFATETTTEVSTAGDTTITGSGDIVALPDDVISVVLPANFKVVADPTGVYGAAVNAGGTLDGLNKTEIADYAGRLILAEPLIVNNKSTTPVKVTAAFKDASVGTTAVADYATATVDTADGKFNTWIAAIPSKDDIAGDVAENYVANDKGIKITSTEASVDLYLPNPVCVISGSTSDNKFTQTLAEGETGHGQAFDIFGVINKNADWSTATGGFGATAANKIEISVKYTIAKAAKTDEMDEAQPYGFTTASGAKLAAVGTPASLGTTATWDKTKATITMDCNLGAGYNKTSVKSVWYGENDVDTEATRDMYSVDATTNKLTVNLGDDWLDWDGTVKVWVELNDGTLTEETITCSK